MRSGQPCSVLLALAVFLPLAACSPRDSDARLETETPDAPVPAAAATPTLPDPQIAHIAVTANAIDIEMGELALTRSATPEIRSFAQTMVTDHTAVNEQAAALAGRLGVVPEDNPVSRSLQDDASVARTRLEGLNGGEFDRAYVEREVTYHQTVLDALDATLIPSATNAELQGLLEQVRPAIAAHLAHARQLQTSLQSGR